MKKVITMLTFFMISSFAAGCSQYEKVDIETVSVSAPLPESIEVSEEGPLVDTEEVSTGSSEPQTGEAISSTATEIQEFSIEDVYVIGNPILSDCLFLKVNMDDIKNIEDDLRHHSGEEFADGGYFIYEAGQGITYVTNSAMDGDLYAIILTTDQFQLGCGLQIGMKEEDIASLKLPFISCSKEEYPRDSLFLEDMSCPFNTLDYDSIYLYQSGNIPEDAVKENSIIAGGRISITALVRDGVVVSVFTNIPVAG